MCHESWRDERGNVIWPSFWKHWESLIAPSRERASKRCKLEQECSSLRQQLQQESLSLPQQQQTPVGNAVLSTKVTFHGSMSLGSTVSQSHRGKIRANFPASNAKLNPKVTRSGDTFKVVNPKAKQQSKPSPRDRGSYNKLAAQAEPARRRAAAACSNLTKQGKPVYTTTQQVQKAALAKAKEHLESVSSPAFQAKMKHEGKSGIHPEMWLEGTPPHMRKQQLRDQEMGRDPDAGFVIGSAEWTKHYISTINAKNEEVPDWFKDIPPKLGQING